MWRRKDEKSPITRRRPIVDDCVVVQIVNAHPDQATINVISKLLNVFAPAKGFFEMMSTHGTPDRILMSMIDDHGVNFSTVEDMYAQEAPAGANMPSSTAGEHRRATSEPTRRVKRTRRYEESDDDLPSDTRTTSEERPKKMQLRPSAK